VDSFGCCLIDSVSLLIVDRVQLEGDGIKSLVVAHKLNRFVNNPHIFSYFNFCVDSNSNICDRYWARRERNDNI